MPGRKIPLVTNEIYHVFNKGVADSPIFKNKRDYQKALETFLYYQIKNIPIRYSKFRKLSIDQRKDLIKNVKEKHGYLVEIIAFCLMPNHFHFILKQKEEVGISKFISNFSNSYSRYFNIKQKRIGSLFQGRFKAVRVETDTQLLHLSRYIHLNPYTSYLVKNIRDLENYLYSSFLKYIGKNDLKICVKEIVINQFKNPIDYKEFVFDHADYQRNLERIKNLALESL
ncbi:hypothetical protein ES702_00896 [subsurface metagenome]